jgi:type IV secretory pathway TraG/TraD family ATPase VirD4
LLGVVPLLFLLVRLIRSTVSAGIHGEAAWAARHEIQTSRTGPWLIPIKVHFRGSRRSWTGGGGMVGFGPSREVTRRHMIVIGGTGSGKGYFIFGHILISCRHALIYQDVKAECSDALMELST